MWLILLLPLVASVPLRTEVTIRPKEGEFNATYLIELCIGDVKGLCPLLTPDFSVPTTSIKGSTCEYSARCVVVNETTNYDISYLGNKVIMPFYYNKNAEKTVIGSNILVPSTERVTYCSASQLRYGDTHRGCFHHPYDEAKAVPCAEGPGVCWVDGVRLKTGDWHIYSGNASHAELDTITLSFANFTETYSTDSSYYYEGQEYRRPLVIYDPSLEEDQMVVGTESIHVSWSYYNGMLYVQKRYDDPISWASRARVMLLMLSISGWFWSNSQNTRFQLYLDIFVTVLFSETIVSEVVDNSLYRSVMLNNMYATVDEGYAVHYLTLIVYTYTVFFVLWHFVKHYVNDDTTSAQKRSFISELVPGDAYPRKLMIEGILILGICHLMADFPDKDLYQMIGLILGVFYLGNTEVRHRDSLPTHHMAILVYLAVAFCIFEIIIVPFIATIGIFWMQPRIAAFGFICMVDITATFISTQIKRKRA